MAVMPCCFLFPKFIQLAREWRTPLDLEERGDVEE